MEKMQPATSGSCSGLCGVAPGGFECVAQRAAGKGIQGPGIGTVIFPTTLCNSRLGTFR